MRNLLAFVVAFFASSLVALAQTAPLHSAARGLDSDWGVFAWGGLKAGEAGAAGERVLRIEVTEQAQPWAGFVLGPGWNQPPSAMLPLTPADVTSGALLLEVNGGTDRAGATRGGQRIQFLVNLADASGTELKGTAGYLGLDAVASEGAIDNDSATWQKVRIPLARVAGAVAPKVAGVKKLSVQVQGGSAADAGFLVRNIRLESAAEAPPAPPVAAVAAELQKLRLKLGTQDPGWSHRVGERVRFNLVFSAESPVTETIQVRYRVGPERFEGPAKTIEVPPEGVEIDGGALDQPGFLRLIATAQVGGKEIKAVATAAVSAEKIQPTQTEPADFDAFWKATRAELAKIPMDPVLVPKPELSGPEFDAYELSLANYDPLGKKPRFYGILCVPKGAGPFPAILQTPGAGVRGYKGEIWVPRAQFITLEVGIHGIPVTEPAKFYQEQAAGPLRDYQVRNLHDRDTFYYRRVYAGVLRSLEFLMSHPKWDGKNLVTRGGSQGGQLAIVGAALEPRVTAVAAAFPAWCDVTGHLHGRAGGWPLLFTGKPPEDEAGQARRAAQVATTAYYDTVNFARRLRVPAYFAWGYNDDVCPPTSFYAMLSVVTAPKEVHVYKDAFHNLPGEGWGGYTNWTVAKARGK